MLKHIVLLALSATLGIQHTANDKDIPVCDGFDFPVGSKPTVSPARNGDGWYDAQPFGRNTHLGEDWNAESGGNSDCGKPVYSVAIGKVIQAGDYGEGWGNVIIIRHRLPNGDLVESLYGHLDRVDVNEGDIIKRRQQIGTVGDGAAPCGDSDPYYAHLHFEIRTPEAYAWGQAGGGYDTESHGWVAPTTFINKHRKLKK